jgi:hypothetical protein
MLRTPIRFLGAGCLAVLVVGVLVRAADTEKEAVHAFEFKIALNMDMDTQGKKQKLDADTEVRYSWKRSGRERTLTLLSARVRMAVDGQSRVNTSMSRAKFESVEQGKPNVIAVENAPEDLKKLLQDSFDVPVCKVEVDENGREVKRTVVAGPGAKALLENGMIANALLFHPPFRRDQAEWQADSEISMGNGGYAKGKLTYKRTAGGKGGQAVKVSGTLTNAGFKQPGTGLTVKNAKYVVSGGQTYDPAQQEWVAGKVTIDVSFEMADDDRPLGSAKGTMLVTFAELPGKK